MFIKPIIITAILLLILGLIVAGCSKHRFHKKSPEEKAEWITDKISSELDLNDSQKVKLNEIKADVLIKYKEHGDFKSDIWNELNSQLKSERINEQSLNDTFSSKEKQFSEMRALLVNKFAEFYAILTPEQRNQLSEKIEKVHNKWRH